jgi:hypothetical protein
MPGMEDEAWMGRNEPERVFLQPFCGLDTPQERNIVRDRRPLSSIRARPLKSLGVRIDLSGWTAHNKSHTGSGDKVTKTLERTSAPLWQTDYRGFVLVCQGVPFLVCPGSGVQCLDHEFVDEGVRCHKVFFIRGVGSSFIGADPAACLLKDHHACGRIPGFQSFLPEPV